VRKLSKLLKQYSIGKFLNFVLVLTSFLLQYIFQSQGSSLTKPAAQNQPSHQNTPDSVPPSLLSPLPLSSWQKFLIPTSTNTPSPSLPHTPPCRKQLTSQASYRLIANSQNFNGFDRHVMENVKIIDATPQGTVDFEFHIDEKYTNLNGVMHGGAAGVIFDMCTTSALGPLAKPGFWEYVLSKDIGQFFPYETDTNKFPRRSDQNAKYQLPESYSHGFASPILMN
jgi:hypothetical protein